MPYPSNPAHFCFGCEKYIGHRGFCSKECHDKWYDEQYSNTKNSKNTIKDDRECKICGKKLSEHSSFSDNHTYISKEAKEE